MENSEGLQAGGLPSLMKNTDMRSTEDGSALKVQENSAISKSTAVMLERWMSSNMMQLPDVDLQDIGDFNPFIRTSKPSKESPQPFPEYT
jgi:hypothetical protein